MDHRAIRVAILSDNVVDRAGGIRHAGGENVRWPTEQIIDEIGVMDVKIELL